MLTRWLAGLVLLLGLPALACAKAPPQTYYALVFNGPVAGREADYNRWYDEQHAPDVVSIPGFVSAQRYKRSDLQLRPDAGASPPYLVVYRIVTDDLPAVYAEVVARIKSGRTRLSPAMAPGGGMNLTYLVTATHNWPAPGKARKALLHVVLTDGNPGQNAALDARYVKRHAPDMAKVPGVTGYALGTLSPTQMIQETAARHHIAMFRIETADLAGMIAHVREVAPGMDRGPGMRNLWGYTYAPIGPELSGDRIRAQRAHR